MNSIPDFITQGERSMLFPVMAESYKEGRAVSTFLSCVEYVHEFGREILGYSDYGVELDFLPEPEEGRGERNKNETAACF